MHRASIDGGAGRAARLVIAAAFVAALAACGDSRGMTGIQTGASTQLVGIVPGGGATGVDPAGAITITFSHAMGPLMEQYVVLHDGSITGPVVATTAVWSADRTRLTLRPTSRLADRTTYVLHIGGGMLDAADRPVGLANCPALGGRQATGQMMGGREMGPRWRDAGGGYGMMFEFTTA